MDPDCWFTGPGGLGFPSLVWAEQTPPLFCIAIRLLGDTKGKPKCRFHYASQLNGTRSMNPVSSSCGLQRAIESSPAHLQLWVCHQTERMSCLSTVTYTHTRQPCEVCNSNHMCLLLSPWWVGLQGSHEKFSCYHSITHPSVHISVVTSQQHLRQLSSPKCSCLFPRSIMPHGNFSKFQEQMMWVCLEWAESKTWLDTLVSF